MQRALVKMLCGATVLMIAACAQQGGVDAAAVSDEMKRGTREFIAAYNSGDIDTVMARFAPDAVILPPGSAPVSGSDEIRKLWTEGSEGLREEGLAVTVKDGDVTGVSGNVGWHAGAYGFKSSAGTDEPGGSYMEAWENREGKWMVVRLIWNEDHVPPPPAEPAPEAPAT
jgi:ketosteroid isomerase-like protein